MEQGPEAQYFSFLARGNHRIQRCDACGEAVFYPRLYCPKCGGGLSWITPVGTGVVYSATTVRRKPEQGGDYSIALVDLTEGARLMTRIVDIPSEDVRIGMPVRFAGVGPDTRTVLYRPEA
ncbi:MAG: OB-fold domain-containing protein [Rhodospirillum sp.]|nr:OB-fold domain-containing protein [Rhodospirillum sp.]MCF8489466.1 OB-fold domain-containing protein [Rhodospirillum sp.]MCF8500818.1 OB-fold domain-containing protein [Rhodospirillum sp.]